MLWIVIQGRTTIKFLWKYSYEGNRTHFYYNNRLLLHFYARFSAYYIYVIILLEWNVSFVHSCPLPNILSLPTSTIPFKLFLSGSCCVSKSVFLLLTNTPSCRFNSTIKDKNNKKWEIGITWRYFSLLSHNRIKYWEMYMCDYESEGKKMMNNNLSCVEAVKVARVCVPIYSVEICNSTHEIGLLVFFYVS